MSHDKVQSINIDTKNKKVYITSYSSNVIPKIPQRCNYPYYAKFFDNGGVEQIKKEILFDFFSGSFQGTSTHYGKCINTFREKYTDKDHTTHDDYTRCYDDAEFRKDFLNRLYEHYLDYEKKRKSEVLFRVKVGSSYIMKLRRGEAITTECLKKAKTFNLADAEILRVRFERYGAEIIPATKKNKTN